MQLIKIKRSSIKKNPNAGRTDFEILGPWNASGKCHDRELPEYLLPFVEITSLMMTSSGPASYEFIFTEPLSVSLTNKLKKEKNISIEFNRDVTYCKSMFPEPDYIFEYHNPLIVCDNCGSKVRHQDIEDDYVVNSDGDEYNVDKCPICGDIDSFDYEFEKISAVMK